jgi:hypothetical protein
MQAAQSDSCPVTRRAYRARNADLQPLFQHVQHAHGNNRCSAQLEKVSPRTYVGYSEDLRPHLRVCAVKWSIRSLVAQMPLHVAVMHGVRMRLLLECDGRNRPLKTDTDT